MQLTFMRSRPFFRNEKGLVIALFLLLVFVPVPIAEPAENELELKKACLKAVIQSIGMEIERYEVKLKAAQNGPGDPANVPKFKNRIAELNAEREKYQSLDPAIYALPEQKTVIVNGSNPVKKGSLLELIDMSRSGPFYHCAGIKNDNFSALKPGRKYTLTVYLIYPREYFFPSSYVYVSGF
jgi:hypothetical protein